MPLLIRLLVVVSIFSSCSILHHHTVATYNKGLIDAPYEVVIVPGLPYDTARLNPMLKARILWAKDLYDSGIAQHIIFSGSAVHSPYVEGLVMKMMADSMGIPDRHTFIEDEAHSGHQNVDYGVKLAHKMGFKKIAVATDPIQTIWLKKHMDKNHEQVALIPFSMKAMPAYYNKSIPAINHSDAFVEDFVPLKKREVVLD